MHAFGHRKYDASVQLLGRVDNVGRESENAIPDARIDFPKADGTVDSTTDDHLSVLPTAAFLCIARERFLQVERRFLAGRPSHIAFVCNVAGIGPNSWRAGDPD